MLAIMLVTVAKGPLVLVCCNATSNGIPFLLLQETRDKYKPEMEQQLAFGCCTASFNASGDILGLLCLTWSNCRQLAIQFPVFSQGTQRGISSNGLIFQNTVLRLSVEVYFSYFCGIQTESSIKHTITLSKFDIKLP